MTEGSAATEQLPATARSAMACWLSDCSPCPIRNPARAYEIVIVPQPSSVNQGALRKAVRAWLRHCYADHRYVRARVASGAYNTAEDLYQMEKFPSPGNDGVKKGDFGEAVAHYLLERHRRFHLFMPVLRLRHKEDPNSAERGIDLLAFRFRERDGVDALCMGEVRLRASSHPRIDDTVVQGHETLRSYTRAREIQAVGRVAHLLHQEGDEAIRDELARFGEGWAQVTFRREHVFIGVLDARVRFDGMIQQMDRETVMPTFVACLVLIGDLSSWVEGAFAP